MLPNLIRIPMSWEDELKDVCWVEGAPAALPTTRAPVARPEPHAPAAPAAPAVSQSPAISLEQALRENRIEFWYQPKIDLRKKMLVGVEAFARLRTPDNKILPASVLMPGATEDSVVALTERALVNALKTSATLCEIGVDVQLAVNMSIDALSRLPIVDLVLQYRPDGDKCLSLLFDVTETQVLRHITEMEKISVKLRACGFTMAVDDFGAALLAIIDDKQACDSTIDQTFHALSKLKDVRFSEMKLDRSLIRDCNVETRKKDICKHFIDLTHSLDSKAVAVGIEKDEELQTLKILGCDIGQGYLFGRPMSEGEFISLLWERSVRTRPAARTACVPSRAPTLRERQRPAGLNAARDSTSPGRR